MKTQSTGLSLWLVVLMAFATGITVASNYYAQPLLHSITNDLDISMEASGVIITVAQFSYALGLLFITPLGDKFERKSLILSLMILTTLGLAISACAHSLSMLLLGTAIAGLFSAVAQVLIPFAATLSDPAARGRIVGTLMAGLLLGILLARTFAGTISNFGQWRAVYAVAAIIMAFVTLCLAISLPRYQHKLNIDYWPLIRSIGSLFVQEPVLRIRALMGGISFCLFSLLWTPLAFLLSIEPYNYSDFIIGLFGIAGAAGALASPIVGRLSDKGKGILVTTIGLISLLIAWLPLSFAQSSLLLLILGIVIIDFAVQVTHVSCMNAIYQIHPEARSRMNSGYMVSYFIGGMVGSISSTYLFSLFGWRAIVCVGVILAIFALIIWLHYLKTSQSTEKIIK